MPEDTIPEDYRESVRQAVLDETFLKAVFSGSMPGETSAWTRVVLRPVLIKGRRSVQFAYYDAKQCTTKNYSQADLAGTLDQLVRLPFKNIYVSATEGELQINVSKKGKPLIRRTRAVQPAKPPDLAHNRQKDFLLVDGKPDPYLQAIGFMTEDGQIRADKQKKFKQINEFLKLLQHTGELGKFQKPYVEIVDHGCGNAYLTFAVYHYLNYVLQVPARLVGVDLQGQLLAKHVETAARLGWDDLTFQQTGIADFVPAAAPDITLSLHACDTATDEALAQGIKWGSKLIISVPCCHHDLQAQINGAPEPFRPVFRHGILGERMGDVLTDAFRALILRIMGYQTDVLQFISAEQTAKNLMIRAVKSDASVPAHLLREYESMKSYWQVTPALEQQLGPVFQQRLAADRKIVSES